MYRGVYKSLNEHVKIIREDRNLLEPYFNGQTFCRKHIVNDKRKNLDKSVLRTIPITVITERTYIMALGIRRKREHYYCTTVTIPTSNRHRIGYQFNNRTTLC